MTTALDQAREAAARLPDALCAACVGRAFARLVPGGANAERGRTIRPDPPPRDDACPLCEGVSARLDRYADLCLAAADAYEWDSFLVGSVQWREVRQREDALYGTLADARPDLRRPPSDDGPAQPPFAPAEYLKAEVNREVGKRIAERTGKRVEFGRPELAFHLDTRLDHVRLQVASLHVQGRYRKHDRTLPQTRWPCRSCNGLGCRACEYAGKTYHESVEELVAAPFVEASGAAGEAFHGMGREDVDARMLGTGRPFVLELKAPRRRRLAWAALAAEVASRSGGRVEALEVGPAPPDAPARFKAADPDKTYHAWCVADAPIPADTLIKAVSSLGALRLEQRTPERVSHRRADRVRQRLVHEVRLRAHAGERFELEIRAQSGTYIKEFVSGDQGRTRPSVTEALGVPCRVAELDVVDVNWKE